MRTAVVEGMAVAAVGPNCRDETATATPHALPRLLRAGVGRRPNGADMVANPSAAAPALPPALRARDLRVDAPAYLLPIIAASGAPGAEAAAARFANPRAVPASTNRWCTRTMQTVSSASISHHSPCRNPVVLFNFRGEDK